MKKIVLILFIMIFTVSFIFAQDKDAGSEFKGFSKNDVILTGSISYNNINNEYTKVNRFSVNPKIGYFINNNLMMGG